MSLDYALRDSAPDHITRFPLTCPTHQAGDEARLDFKHSGWQGARCNGKHKGKSKCIPKYRFSFLCDSLRTEYYCEATLPKGFDQLKEVFG